MSSGTAASSLEVVPYLLYCAEDGAARFATWQLAKGHETVALFTSEAVAEKYRAELSEPARWLGFQPTRDKLIEILQACRSAGILYAALDPADGIARTLFDIPRVLEGSQRSEIGSQRSEQPKQLLTSDS